jgi:putative ABC transport system ATP-binding protein
MYSTKPNNLNIMEEKMDNQLIELKEVNKIYNKDNTGEIFALNNVSLKIKKGEFVAIIGSSGSGKSTLMNILGCIDKPTNGNYILENIEVSKLTDIELAKIRNNKIGFVFQKFYLLPKTSALENVQLPLIYSDKKNISDLAKSALEDVNLEHRMNHHPGELSGGQQQRVAIARAIVNSPEIILADEPTGNLDSAAGTEIMELFKVLNLKGNTVVIITHEKHIAEYANRIISISDGKIVSDN